MLLLGKKFKQDVVTNSLDTSVSKFCSDLNLEQTLSEHFHKHVILILNRLCLSISINMYCKVLKVPRSILRDKWQYKVTLTITLGKMLAYVR